MNRSLVDRRAAAPAGGRRLLIGFFVAAVCLYWISLSVYLPTLPVYLQSKTRSLALVGTVLAQYGLWQAIMRLPLGIAADWLGRHKPLIIVGFALSGLGALILGTAGSVGQLAVGRAITGIAGATWVPLVAVFCGLFPPHEAVRAAGLLTFASSFANMLGMAATGPLNALGGYSLAFFVAAGTAVLAILVLLPAQSLRHAPRRPSLGAIGRLVTRRDVLLPSLLSAVGQYVDGASSLSFMPILAQELGATDMALSGLLTFRAGMFTLGTLGASRIVKRVGTRRLVCLSFLFLCAGLGLAAAARSLAPIVLAQFLMGTAQGLSYPVLLGLSIRNVDDTNRSTAVGLHQSVYAIGIFIGPWLSGVLADAMGIQPMFGVTAGVCLVLALALARWLTANG